MLARFFLSAALLASVGAVVSAPFAAAGEPARHLPVIIRGTHHEPGQPIVIHAGAPIHLVVIRPRFALAPGSPRPERMEDCDKALAGDAAAAFRMAQRQLYGDGYRRDPKSAAAWVEIAAKEGDHAGIEVIRALPRGAAPANARCRPGWTGVARNPPPPPPAIHKLVEDLAAEQGLDPALVLAVVRAESNFQPDAVSPKDAAGLMQLIPATANRFAVADVFDPTDNIRGGVRYLRWLLSYFRGDVTLALAGYNAGEGAVDRYRGVPPYRETRNYIATIRQWYDARALPFDPALTTASPVVAGNR